MTTTAENCLLTSLYKFAILVLLPLENIMANANRPLVYDTKMLLMMRSNDHDFIKQVAKSNNVSMGEVIRSLIADLKEKEEVNINQNTMAF